MTPSFAGRRRLLETALGVPFTERNAISVLRNGDEVFPAMLDAIRSARDSIDFLTFVYWTGDIADRFAEALSEAARRGVDTRVVLDSFGALKMRRDLISLMEAAGVEVRWFRPLRFMRPYRNNHRTHRKVLVIDGRVGFTGGVGIAEEWEGDARHPGEWRDTHFRISGPAVDGLQAAFLGNWSEAGRPVTVRPPPAAHATEGQSLVQSVRSTASFGWSDIATLTDAALQSAEARIRIATAYFVPDDDTIAALAGAVERGVDVDVMLPGPHTDQRMSQLAGQATFDALLDAGIGLWSYEKTMLHCKVMLVDSELACIGTANFNQRSMRRDDELVLSVLDRQVCQILDSHFEEDLSHCRRIEESRWQNRGLLQRAKERLGTLARDHV